MGLMSQLQLEMSTWTNKITDFTYLCHVNQQPVICPHVLLLLLLLLGQRHGDSDQIHSAMLNTRYPGLINWTVDFLTCIKQHTQTHTHSHTQTHTHTHTLRDTHTHTQTHTHTHTQRHTHTHSETHTHTHTHSDTHTHTLRDTHTHTHSDTHTHTHSETHTHTLRDTQQHSQCCRESQRLHSVSGNASVYSPFLQHVSG